MNRWPVKEHCQRNLRSSRVILIQQIVQKKKCSWPASFLCFCVQQFLFCCCICAWKCAKQLFVLNSTSKTSNYLEFLQIIGLCSQSHNQRHYFVNWLNYLSLLIRECLLLLKSYLENLTARNSCQKDFVQVKSQMKE